MSRVLTTVNLHLPTPVPRKLVFVTEAESVYSAVGLTQLYKAVNFCLSKVKAGSSQFHGYRTAIININEALR